MAVRATSARGGSRMPITRWLGAVRIASCALLVAIPACSVAHEQNPGAGDASPGLSLRTSDGEALRTRLHRFGVGDLSARSFDADATTIRPRDFPDARRARPLLELPRVLRDGFVLDDRVSGVEFRARLRGASEANAEIAGSSVLYAKGLNGTHDVVHRVTDDGTEDFVLLEAPDVSEVVYDLELGARVAGLRLVANVLELLDAQGAPRLRMAAPYVIDADRSRHEAHVTVVGCAFDGDATGPWGRPVTAPGARVCPLRIQWDGARVNFPALLDPTWSSTGSMATQRSIHAATLLGTGKVLVSGGWASTTTYLSTAEIFDPATSTWGTTGSMSAQRYSHRANIVAGGKVLVTGGVTLSTTELYDPSTGTWTSAGVMTAARSSHTATVLASGNVLVAGPDSTAEIYSVGAGGWSATGTMTSKRFEGTAILLPSGKVMFVGGQGTGVLSTAELYDPAAGTWTATGSMASRRYYPVASVLGSGKVLVAGGHNGTFALSTAELYDPAAGTWTSTGSMATVRYHAALLPVGGRMLLLGGSDHPTPLSSAEVYDPLAGTWAAAGNMTVARDLVTATLLNNGRVLVAGGSAGATLSTAELFGSSLGVACSGSWECASGICVDGVCCAAGCAAACSACDIAGSVGTCTAVTSGAPHGSRSCAPFGTCVSGACATTCTLDSDCSSTSRCTGGKCVSKSANGAVCSAGSECMSSFCTDGRCCNTSCGSQCEACDIAGKVGTCAPIAGTPHGTRTACSGVDPGTTCGIACDGLDASKCTYSPKSTPCSANTCVGGVETHASTCDAAGKCNDVPKSCAPYLCDATACKSSCASAADCVAGADCKAKVCTVTFLPKLGDPCTDASSCPSSAFCTDGVCCDKAVCPAGTACSTVTKKGTCAKANGIDCKADAECGSALCSDGVCCDRRCDQQCEACDITGKVGTCGPVVGPPRAGRPKCSTGTDVCSAATCDGTAAGTCAGFVGTDVTCGKATCSGSIFTDVPVCDGKGSCKTKPGLDCGKYTCDEKGCRSTCSAPDHCATGFACVGGACVPKSAKCSADRTASIDTTGTSTPCTPVLCDGPSGICGSVCKSDADCVTGTSCDSSGKCVPPTTAADQGGCGWALPGHGSRARDAAGLAIALFGLRMVQRRRSRTRHRTDQ